jgi:hypothetical protein
MLKKNKIIFIIMQLLRAPSLKRFPRRGNQNKSPCGGFRGRAEQLIISHSSRPGVTLLELLVAIGVSIIVVTLSFTVFSDLLRGFVFQKNRALSIGEMVLAKKQIDQCLSDIAFIKECTDRSITCKKNDADAFVTIRLLKDSLCVGNKAACRQLKDFTFSLVKKSRVGPWVLLWNAQLKKSNWFGGAIYGSK